MESPAKEPAVFVGWLIVCAACPGTNPSQKGRRWCFPYDMVAVRMEPTRSDMSADPFDALFRCEYPRVAGIARRILGDAHLAEDVAQDVFASFYRSQKACAPNAPSWLHAAAVHTALNVIRGNRRRLARDEREARSGQLLASEQTPTDPLEALEERERRREVAEALRRLPTKSRAVLALRYSGLSYAEVAAALQVGINQVGTMLARAEAAFKKEMERVAPR